MRWQLRDPEVRAKVWPDYTFGCKRVLFSSHWLPALQRPNVEPRTPRRSPAIEASGVRTADGALHEVDCIIWGTGFKTTDFMLPMQVRGRDGHAAERGLERTGPTPTSGSRCRAFPRSF